ncbi:MAG: pyruvate ferredoxin oxidoreductase [Oscillospiraceae bacterium]|nr:pyruvate ferredoxin oxidoreductase [Oscillospiraceae bacterium]
MSKRIETGNTACALAVLAAGIDYMAAYPITPQTTLSEKIANFAATGEFTGKYVLVESEHSAMSAVAAASAVGARTFTATSSQGLLHMHEILHYASGGRLPVVMANINRAVLAPWCLYADHQDSISQRDTGWLQLFCSNHQEIYDSVFLAYKVAEKVDIPVMISYDGFLLSHSLLPFETVDDSVIKQYLPDRDPAWRLHPDIGGNFSNVAMAAEYSAYRHRLADDTLKSLQIFRDSIKEYENLTGRKQPDLIEASGTENANVYLLSMGSMASEMELVATELTKQGINASALKLRLYRPFPSDELVNILPDGSTLIVLDRNIAYGHPGGVLYMEARSALYESDKKIRVLGGSVGLGGVDLTVSVLLNEVNRLLEVAKA